MLLKTKIYMPKARLPLVKRERLHEKLSAGLSGKLSLITASAGFGKTSLVIDWLAASGRKLSWLSLDAADSNPARFLTYLVASVQTASENFGSSLLEMVQADQLPAGDILMTSLINDLVALKSPLILVLDDYHLIENPVIDEMLGFLLEHQPSQLHLIITTRQDPALPLARLRGRGELTEIRDNDLRFSPAEAQSFLNESMKLKLSVEAIQALESRTEGWIAGLQLAAISVQGSQNSDEFIRSFTASHRFVIDYLLEEVLHRQPPAVQQFLLKTSILERFCASLCDAVQAEEAVEPGHGEAGQVTLDYLERANLFLVPLDHERKWYRYHHLFAQLLRQRLRQDLTARGLSLAPLHQRASQWFEDHDLELEAFHYATKANDISRAIRLIEGKPVPLHFRGAIVEIRNWLDSLDRTILDDYPVLWTTYASVTLVAEKTAETEAMLRAAEAALGKKETTEATRDQLGRIAAIRSTIAVSRRQVERIIQESERALDLLHPHNLAFRLSTAWKLGFAYQLQGKRQEARQAYLQVVKLGKSAGDLIFSFLARVGLASLDVADNRLRWAERSYKKVAELSQNLRGSMAYFQSQLGLAQLYYEWNELEQAEKFLNALASQAEMPDSFMDSHLDYKLLQVRLELARGKSNSATQTLEAADHYAKEHQLLHRLTKLSEVWVQVYLRVGDLNAAETLLRQYPVPLSQVRLHLAKAEAGKATMILEPLLQDAQVKKLKDKELHFLVLLATALLMQGLVDRALASLAEAFALAEPEGFIRTFVDEGAATAALLKQAIAKGLRPDYAKKILLAYATGDTTENQLEDSSLETLSERELEVLRLIAEGLSNRQIAERLYRALDTIKGYNRLIFEKLQVRNRTEAVARARDLGLL